MNSLRLSPVYFFVFCFSPIILVVAGCTPAPSLPDTAQQATIPPLPFSDPNIRGQEGLYAPAIASLDEALACLDRGQTVVGIALENSNVRAAATVDACRMGRAPQGRLVHVERIFVENGETPFAAEYNGNNGAAIGYEEDILPIFQRNCNACHGEIARTAGLQVTNYAALMAGSDRGSVLVPGDADASRLWQQLRSGIMPIGGELSDAEKALVKTWIDAGVPLRRAPQPTAGELWLQIDRADVDLAPNRCDAAVDAPQTLVNGELIQFLSCGAEPDAETLARVRNGLDTRTVVAPANGDATPENAAAAGTGGAKGKAAPVASNALAATAAANISTAALGLTPPTDDDPFLIPQGGFCIEQRLPRLKDQWAISAMTFAPDGRLFLALDAPPTGQNVDPLVLFDAFHPSRSIAVYDSINDSGFGEIFTESSRITGLDYHQGALYVSRAGEVGRIPDGGEYRPLAGGFAVNSQLFHANNGIAIADGWVYVSAGGVRDGWSDGPIENIGEAAAIGVVAGGNSFAARLVRAPLDQLLSRRSIEVFQTAARGLRNPYGLTRGPDGRLWFTDNGATNVPEGISAGDEVNVFDPRANPPGTPEESTPFYGFPLALSGNGQDWSAQPVLDLPNTSAPTGITWAFNTIFFAQYGRDPGVYRLGRADGRIVAERILMAWPVLSLATAPDGALWVGTGTGGLYRMTPGCE